jgi:putative endonuclease
MRLYCVYMCASRSRVLYIGVTSALKARVYQHQTEAFPGFTSKYNVNRLVWYEAYENPIDAIEREKQLKRWARRKKVWLIERENPHWRDLYGEI